MFGSYTLWYATYAICVLCQQQKPVSIAFEMFAYKLCGKPWESDDSDEKTFL